jgi:GNAT superfamily N-acetyltransferase
MDKPPAPMFRDYGPLVEAGTTWVTGSPITAVLTLYRRDDDLYVENIAVGPSAQGRGLGRALMEFAEQEAARRKLNRMALVTHEAMTVTRPCMHGSATSKSSAGPRTATGASTWTKPLTD